MLKIIIIRDGQLMTYISTFTPVRPGRDAEKVLLSLSLYPVSPLRLNGAEGAMTLLVDEERNQLNQRDGEG